MIKNLMFDFRGMRRDLSMSQLNVKHLQLSGLLQNHHLQLQQDVQHKSLSLHLQSFQKYRQLALQEQTDKKKLLLLRRSPVLFHRSHSWPLSVLQLPPGVKTLLMMSCCWHHQSK
jgi:hypothetical protein